MKKTKRAKRTSKKSKIKKNPKMIVYHKKGAKPKKGVIHPTSYETRKVKALATRTGKKYALAKKALTKTTKDKFGTKSYYLAKKLHGETEVKLKGVKAVRSLLKRRTDAAKKERATMKKLKYKATQTLKRPVKGKEIYDIKQFQDAYIKEGDIMAKTKIKTKKVKAKKAKKAASKKAKKAKKAVSKKAKKAKKASPKKAKKAKAKKAVAKKGKKAKKTVTKKARKTRTRKAKKSTAKTHMRAVANKELFVKIGKDKRIRMKFNPIMSYRRTNPMKKFDLKNLSFEGITKHNAIEAAGLFAGGALHGATIQAIYKLSPALGGWLQNTFKNFTESVVPLALGLGGSIAVEKFVKNAGTQAKLLDFTKGIIGASVVGIGRAASEMILAPAKTVSGFVTSPVNGFVTDKGMDGFVTDMGKSNVDFGGVDFGKSNVDFGQNEEIAEDVNDYEDEFEDEDYREAY